MGLTMQHQYGYIRSSGQMKLLGVLDLAQISMSLTFLLAIDADIGRIWLFRVYRTEAHGGDLFASIKLEVCRWCHDG